MSNEIIKQIRQLLYIKQTAEEAGLKIERKGSRSFILCPWHPDKNPSAELFFKENKGYCHACKKSFDSIDLYSHLHGITLDDAIRRLKEQFGLDDKPTQGKTIYYDYTDETGKLLYQVCRKQPKGFFQRQPDGKGGWINNLRGVKLVPYRLPELLRAFQLGDVVYIIEGEKDSDNVIKLGLVATCNSGGAGKWVNNHSRYFPAGCEVVILPDNDEPGEKHAQSVAKQLYERGCKVRIVKLPDLPPKGDVSDWLAAGHTKEETLAIVGKTPYWEPEVIIHEPKDIAPEPLPTKNIFSLTELGTAERLIAENAGNIRYCPEMKLFLIWDGKRWRKDTDGEIKRLAIKTVRSMYDVRHCPEPEQQVKWAKACESRAKLESVVELAKSLPGVPVSITELDQGRYFVNCLNGTIDLKSGELLSHNRSQLITHLLPFKYRPYAADKDCQRWVTFLHEVTGGNSDLMIYLWKLCGLCLSGDISEHALNIFYGSVGRNGKGTLIGVMQSILGELQTVLPFSSLEPKHSGGIPNDIASMCGKRLVIAQESNEGRRIDEAMIKSLTGGDMLTGRFLRAEFFTFKPSHKLILATNHKPVITETTNAIWSRLRLIPFEVSFLGREDKKLDEKLNSELEGIFAWCVAGFALWQKEGLPPPECVQIACKQYRAGEDVVQVFLDECCCINEHVSVPAKDLYETFRTWCERNGEKPLTRRVFYDRIEGRNFRRYMGNGVTRFKGVGILDFKRQIS